MLKAGAVYISDVPVCLCTAMDDPLLTSTVADGVNMVKKWNLPGVGDMQSVVVSLAALAVSIVAVVDPKLFA